MLLTWCLRYISVTGNERINFQEFLEMMVKKKKNDDTDEMKKAFEVFDKDGSGYISVEKLRQVMTQIGENLTDDELVLMIQEADVNDDGQVDYQGNSSH